MVTFSTRVLAALLLAISIAAPDAGAQAIAGAFTPFLPDNWWRQPSNATLGINYDGTVIHIDRNGDGTNEAVFQRPIGETGIPDAAITSLRLTPTRTIVYAFGGSCGFGGTLVYFYQVPTSGDRLTPILTGLCIPHGIDRVSFYDTSNCTDDGTGTVCPAAVSPRRIALFVTDADEPGAVNFIWVDLTNGAVSGPDFDFAKNLGFIDISPSGTHAFVQHDLGLVVPPETDYRLIDLCPGASFGLVVNQGDFPIANSPDLLRAAVTSVAGGVVTIRVATQFGDEERVVADFDDCLAAHGACCFTTGSCNANLRLNQCPSTQATYLGAGTACSACPTPPVLEACCFTDGTPACARLEATSCTSQGGTPQPGHPACTAQLCPQAAPALLLSGPTAAQIGDRVSYLLDYENMGGAPAHAVAIQIAAPFGTTDVVATGGGVVANGVVTWTIGELPAGASGSVGIAFTLGCDASYVSLQGSILHTPLGGSTTYIPSPRIEFTVDPLPSAPLSVALAALPSQDPLHPGDETTHTITLSNTSGAAVENVRVAPLGAPEQGMSLGAAVSYARTVDTGGGLLDASGGSLRWSGDVAPGATPIEFVTAVDTCIPAGTVETRFDGGTPIAAYDACGVELGRSGDPAPLAVEPVVEAALAVPALAPPETLDAPVVHAKVQVTRPGATAQVQISLGSKTGSTIPNASIQLELAGLHVTTPPTAAGASLDAAGDTISWSGNVPSGAPLTIDFAAEVTACRGELRLSGSTGAGCSDLRDELLVAAVPAPPTAPWLAAVGTRPAPFGPGQEQHLVRIDPGPPATISTVLCLPSEFVTSIGSGPDGTIWTAWLPTIALNPATLAFEAFQLDPLEATGLDSLEDIAVDPRDGAVYFSGSHVVPGVGTTGIIARRDPQTHALASWYEDDGVSSFGQMVVDANGSIAAVFERSFQSDGIARIDPGVPPTATLFEDVGLPADVALDDDGSYLVIDRYGSPASLVDVDPHTGATHTVVGDLGATFAGATGWQAVESDGAGRLIVAPAPSGLGALSRPGPTSQTLLPIGFAPTDSYTDITLVGRATPEPSSVALALAAIAGLAVRHHRTTWRRGSGRRGR